MTQTFTVKPFGNDCNNSNDNKLKNSKFQQNESPKNQEKCLKIDIDLKRIELEKEFIIEALPCKLLGMNSDSMAQYIEFVSDRLLVQFGCNKLYNATNPFEFMERIGMDVKALQANLGRIKSSLKQYGK